MHVACLTNDKNLWAVRVFAHLFNRFWGASQRVEVVGFHPPQHLPGNFSFYQVAAKNWPAEMWTDQLIKYLSSLDDELLILMLEDYWLVRPVNLHCITKMWGLAKQLTTMPSDQKLLRIDLTADRASKKQAKHFVTDGEYNVISTPAHTPYQMSYQAAIWHVPTLLEVLVRRETPWQSEVDGSQRLKQRGDLLVLGTEVHPLYYVPALRRHKIGIPNWGKIPADVRAEIKPLIPADKMR